MLTLTEAAAEKVRQLMEKEQKQDHGLRVFIQGGGCAGFSYGLAFDRPRPDDHQFVVGEIPVLVDPLSARYLEGAEIDYVDGLMGAGFSIHNPNAVATCACGHSFNTTGTGALERGVLLVTGRRPIVITPRENLPRQERRGTR